MLYSKSHILEYKRHMLALKFYFEIDFPLGVLADWFAKFKPC